jgi:hypothetical protein
MARSITKQEETMNKTLARNFKSARWLIIVLISFLSINACTAQNLTTPIGVRLLENKSLDDSEEVRRRILDLYQDLRLTDVLDGMDLIGLQEIGIPMDETVREYHANKDHGKRLQMY